MAETIKHLDEEPSDDDYTFVMGMRAYWDGQNEVFDLTDDFYIYDRKHLKKITMSYERMVQIAQSQNFSREMINALREVWDRLQEPLPPASEVVEVLTANEELVAEKLSNYLIELRKSDPDIDWQKVDWQKVINSAVKTAESAEVSYDSELERFLPLLQVIMLRLLLDWDSDKKMIERNESFKKGIRSGKYQSLLSELTTQHLQNACLENFGGVGHMSSDFLAALLGYVKWLKA